MMDQITFDTFLNVINGKFVGTAHTKHGINPATLEKLHPVPLSSQDDIEEAVSAAQQATRLWSRTPLEERQHAVLSYAEALAGQVESFSRMLVLEQGKPLSVARTEVLEAVRMLKGVAQLDFKDEVVDDSIPTRRTITRYIPVGVCVGIIPWNFPVTLACFKLGPALVSGCAIILKPSPFTPYTGLKLAELAQRFFPPGVVQALSGDDLLGPSLTSHPGVAKISFTGSTQTGIKVMQSCASTLKRVTLELGGNDAAIVCSDVDVADVAAKVSMLALYNSGQVCIAIKRVYVHESIYDEFLSRVVDYTKTLVVGNGFNSHTVLGPVQNSIQFKRVNSLITSIKDANLKVVLGGDAKDLDTKGYFIHPMIIDDPPDDSRIVTEEPFGPIFPVLRWRTETEVIERVNNSLMGLGASVWTGDLSTARRIARRLEVGNVWINTHLELHPDMAFSGHKHSGIGSELGIDGIKSYCNTQVIYE